MPWVALVLATSWSWYGLTKRRVPLDPIASLSSELFVLVVPAFALVIGGFLRSDGIPDQATGSDWPLLIGTGAITAIPLLLFAFAAQRVPFTILGPTNYLVPLINFLLGWLAFDESLPPSRVVGFVLVWVALMLVTLDMARERAPRAAARSCRFADGSAPPAGRSARFCGGRRAHKVASNHHAPRGRKGIPCVHESPRHSQQRC